MKYLKVLAIGIVCALALVGCGKKEADNLSKGKTEVKVENEILELEKNEKVTLGEYFQTISGIEKVPEEDVFVINGINWEQEYICGLWSEEKGFVRFEEYAALYPIKEGFIATAYREKSDKYYDYPVGVLLDKNGKVIYQGENENYRMYVVNNERIFVLSAQTGFDGLEAMSGVLDNNGDWVCPMQNQELPENTIEFAPEGEKWKSDLGVTDGIVTIYDKSIYSSFTDKIFTIPIGNASRFYLKGWKSIGGSLSSGSDSVNNIWRFLDEATEQIQADITDGLYNYMCEGWQEEVYSPVDNVLCNVKRETIKMPEYFKGKKARYCGKIEDKYYFDLEGLDGAKYCSVVKSNGEVEREPLIIGKIGEKVSIWGMTNQYIAVYKNLPQNEEACWIYDWITGEKIFDITVQTEEDIDRVEFVSNKYLVIQFSNGDQTYLKIYSMDGTEM